MSLFLDKKNEDTDLQNKHTAEKKTPNNKNNLVAKDIPS